MFWGKFVSITMQQNYTEPTTTNANCAAWSTFISTHPVCLSRCGICAHVASPLIIKKPKPTSRIKKFKLFLLMFLLIWASSRLENKCLLEVCWKWRIWRPLHLVQKKVQISQQTPAITHYYLCIDNSIRVHLFTLQVILGLHILCMFLELLVETSRKWIEPHGKQELNKDNSSQLSGDVE